ncbi:MAG: restriction endonuclease subunit S [Campylobacter sp.]|uniref:restriction endonuclease subunit S n=1 Tax=Campylobacter sp. TaxID=205 RepID=UPI00259C8A14|nr:restriction endonuclease subunit S [Campylobacter sp.]MBE6430258.1 restriction endonuclease subunit S [Campylobacter sp.]
MHEIPKGWKVKKLGEICILDKGKIENCGELPYLEVKFLRNLKNADIKEKGIVVEKNQAVILVDGENSGEVFKVKTKGYLGSTFRILKLSDNVNFDYFIFFMNFVSLKFKNSKVGSAIPHLNKKLFNECEIPLPNLVEQKAIVDKLDDSFAKIENAITNLINAKENLKLYKQSALKSAFNGDLLPNTSPTHWEVKKLGEIISKEKYSMKRGPFGSALKKEFFVDNGIRVFEQYNPINSDPHWKRYFITKEKFKELEAFKASAGDLLISCSGTLGKILELPKNTEIGIINQALLKIKLDQKQILNSFFIHYFNSNKFQNLILEKQ